MNTFRDATARRLFTASATVAAALSGCGESPPEAAVETESSGLSAQFTAVADARVEAAYPNNNFGTSTVLAANSSPQKESYLRFNVTGLTAAVTKATVRLYITDGSTNGPAIYKSNDNWAESTITYANRPATIGSALGNKGALTTGTWVSYVVTSAVTGNGSYSFKLVGDSTDGTRFNSREASSNKPQLVITTQDSAPPPAGTAFLAPADGATVSGITTVRVSAPAGTQWIGIYACGGISAGEDLVQDPDGNWSIQWDTQMQGCSSGSQPLDAYAFTNAGAQLGEAHINVTIQNSAPPPPPPPPGPCTGTEPGPIAGQGYTQRFGDCFDTLDRSVWCSHQWWEPEPPVGTQYVDSSGVIHIVRRRSDGYPDNTISSEPCGQANPKSFQQGYFEARMKFTDVPGSGPSFWLFSTRHATNPAWPNINPYCANNGLPAEQCWVSELDVFEGYGNHLDVFTGTLHRDTGDEYGATDDMNSNNWHPLAAGTDLGADWHVYAAKWTATTVSWYVDGTLMMSTPVWASTNQPMHMLFYNWATDWESGNGVGPSTPDELHTMVDWVRVWQL